MTYGQDPQMLAKLGGPSDFTKDPAFIQALARIIAQQGMRQGTQMTPGLMEGMSQGAAEDGFQQDAGLANSLYAPSQMEPAPQPLPGVGSGADLALANAGFEQAPAGMAYEDGSVQQEPAVKQDMGAKPKKKKGEYSDFFKLLKAAKSGDKTTKKSITDLAKQLEASGGEVPVS